MFVSQGAMELSPYRENFILKAIALCYHRFYVINIRFVEYSYTLSIKISCWDRFRNSSLSDMAQMASEAAETMWLQDLLPSFVPQRGLIFFGHHITEVMLRRMGLSCKSIER